MVRNRELLLRPRSVHKSSLFICVLRSWSRAWLPRCRREDRAVALIAQSKVALLHLERFVYLLVFSCFSFSVSRLCGDLCKRAERRPVRCSINARMQQAVLQLAVALQPVVQPAARPSSTPALVPERFLQTSSSR